MSDCHAHPWNEPTGLDCQRTDPHERGHVYAAAWFPDRHDVEREEDQ